MVSIVFRWIMILVVEGRITRGSVHHASRLSVHHVAHRRVRTVCTAWTCRQWWKHYTLLWLELCSVIGRRQLDMLVESLPTVFNHFWLQDSLYIVFFTHQIYLDKFYSNPKTFTKYNFNYREKKLNELCLCIFEKFLFQI